jgi:ribonuclease-3
MPRAALADRLGHRFADPALLELAMVHRSWCAEHPGTSSNERLEFLGDAILGFVVAETVYRRFPDMSEGQLTDVRKAVVNATTLAEIAVEIDLGPGLWLGKGEDNAGGRSKASILADAVEAVLGAVYLDGGPQPAHALVLLLLGDRIDRAVEQLGRADHKTQLQELTAARFSTAPSYLLSDSGPDHAKEFVARVVVDGRALGEGTGRSKKQAEQAAAAAAVRALEADHSA